jgi:hypothetical protein
MRALLNRRSCLDTDAYHLAGVSSVAPRRMDRGRSWNSSPSRQHRVGKAQHYFRMESYMSDPRYTDPVHDPRRTRPRDPNELRSASGDDTGRTATWSWIIGIVAVIVVAMLVYGNYSPLCGGMTRV